MPGIQAAVPAFGPALPEIVLAVGALQFVLDQGQMRDWFNSRLIVVGTIIAVFATAAFFLRGWNKTDNIIDLSLLRDRNFVLGTLAITAYGTGD